MQEQMMNTAKSVYNTLYGYGNKGIDTAEEVQKQMFAMSYDTMEKAPIMSEVSGYVKQTRDLHSEMMNTMYTNARKANEAMKSMTDDMMNTVESAVKSMTPAKA
jgi:predicted small metal-binding protein